MPRRNYPSKSAADKHYDTEYISLPEYPQYNSVVVVPLKTIFYNLDAAHNANDFYVARRDNDRIFKKITKKIENGVSA